MTCPRTLGLSACRDQETVLLDRYLARIDAVVACVCLSVCLPVCLRVRKMKDASLVVSLSEISPCDLCKHLPGITKLLPPLWSSLCAGGSCVGVVGRAGCKVSKTLNHLKP